MYGLQFNNSNQKGPAKRKVAPSATPDKAPTSYKTTEGNAARKLAESLDKMSFDTTGFAQSLISVGGPMLRRRILDIAIAVIKEYASQWQTMTQDEVSRDAMRLNDTLDQFKM